MCSLIYQRWDPSWEIRPWHPNSAEQSGGPDVELHHLPNHNDAKGAAWPGKTGGRSDEEQSTGQRGPLPLRQPPPPIRTPISTATAKKVICGLGARKLS